MRSRSVAAVLPVVPVTPGSRARLVVLHAAVPARGGPGAAAGAGLARAGSRQARTKALRLPCAWLRAGSWKRCRGRMVLAGLVPLSVPGVIPLSVPGIFPLSLPGVVPLSVSGIMPLSLAGDAPLSLAGVVPLSLSGVFPSVSSRTSIVLKQEEKSAIALVCWNSGSLPG